MLELVLRFLLVGTIAFGGGQAALPLVERIAVAETSWLSPQDFAVAVGLAYATPGPVLILAAYVGFRVSGVLGGVAATLAVFAIPVVLAGFAAHLVTRFQQARWFVAFGRYAGAAAIGLLGVTLTSLALPVIEIHPALLAPAALILFADQRGLPPVLLILIATVAGALVGLTQ